MSVGKWVMGWDSFGKWVFGNEGWGNKVRKVLRSVKGRKLG